MKPLNMLGKVFKFIFPKVELDLLFRKCSQYKRMIEKHKSYGFNAERLIQAHNQNAEKFNKNKYFWMKKVEKIEKEKTGENT